MCSVKEAFEYTFDDVRLSAKFLFNMYIDNGLFTVHFEFIFNVKGVSNIDTQEIYIFISVFIFYDVLESWISFVWNFLKSVYLMF